MFSFQALKRVSSYPACPSTEPKEIAKPRRHEQTQSQHESVETTSEYTISSNELPLDPSSREPLLNAIIANHQTNTFIQNISYVFISQKQMISLATNILVSKRKKKISHYGNIYTLRMYQKRTFYIKLKDWKSLKILIDINTKLNLYTYYCVNFRW